MLYWQVRAVWFVVSVLLSYFSSLLAVTDRRIRGMSLTWTGYDSPRDVAAAVWVVGLAPTDCSGSPGNPCGVL